MSNVATSTLSTISVSVLPEVTECSMHKKHGALFRLNLLRSRKLQVTSLIQKVQILKKGGRTVVAYLAEIKLILEALAISPICIKVTHTEITSSSMLLMDAQWQLYILVHLSFPLMVMIMFLMNYLLYQIILESVVSQTVLLWQQFFNWIWSTNCESQRSHLKKSSTQGGSEWRALQSSCTNQQSSAG